MRPYADINGDFHWRPAKEVESLRGAWFPWPVSTLNNQQTTMVDNCEAMEVNLRWDCARSSAEQYAPLSEANRPAVEKAMREAGVEF